MSIWGALGKTVTAQVACGSESRAAAQERRVQEAKDADEKLDAFKGDPESAEYAELVERELGRRPTRAAWRSAASAHPQHHCRGEDYAKTAQAEDGAEAPPAEDAKH